MPDIHIERPHHLGFAKAREAASNWADVAGQKLGVECEVVPGDGVETIQFQRSGVQGMLRVDADRFTFDARLGLLAGAFSKQIETEVERSLDALIAGQGPEVDRA